MNCRLPRIPAIFTVLLTFTLLQLLPGPATAGESPKVEKVVTIEGITEYRLENGVRFLLFPDSSAPTVTVNMTVLVGSRHEGYGETGMAHLLEHMLFKGSKDFPDGWKPLANRGAEFNGTTWLDRTNYYETLPATDDNLEFGIKYEADRLVNSFIRREDLQNALGSFVRASECDPLSLAAHRNLAELYESMGRKREALRHLGMVHRLTRS